MMNNSQTNKNPGFLMQGSILAAASVICKLIGLIYRIPMTDIIGDEGNNYYSCAFDLYNVLLIVSSYSLPVAISRLVSARLAKDQKKEAYRVFKAGLLLAFLLGTAAALILWFCSGLLTSTIMKTPDSIFALRVLCPVLILVSLLGAFRGFFQGLGIMKYTAVSQIIEQIVNAIVSVWAAYMLFEYGRKVGNVLGHTEAYQAAYGAAGGTLGTASGAACGLLAMVIIFIIFGKSFRLEVREEEPMEEDSISYVLRTLLLTLLPVLLASLSYNISGLLDQIIFKNIALLQGYSEDMISTWWGVFSGKYKVLANIPAVIATAIAMSVVPVLTQSHISHRKEEECQQIECAFRFVLLADLPCAAGLGIFALPIVSLLFAGQPDTIMLAVHMIWLGIPAIIFVSLSTLSIGVLQGLGHYREPVRNACIAIFCHLLLLVLLMLFLRISIYAVVAANAFFALLLFFLNMREIYRHSSFRFSIKKTILPPLICTFMMSVLSFALYEGIYILSGMSSLSFICTFVFAVLIYIVLIFLTRSVSEKEIREMPKGAFWADMLGKLHLL